MSENDNDTGNDQAGRNWRQLEKARDNALAQAQAWQAVALQGLVASGGFDPKDPVVSLLVKEFSSGELDPTELDHTSFVEFAKGFNVTPKPVEPPAAPAPTVQEQVAALQAQAGQPQVPQPQVPGQPQAQTPAAPPQALIQHMGFQNPADALLTSSGTHQVQPTGDLASRAARASAAVARYAEGGYPARAIFDRAAASIRGELSVARTRTPRRARWTASSPVPQFNSSTRSPALRGSRSR